jgi:uncharacterized membrane protein
MITPAGAIEGFAEDDTEDHMSEWIVIVFDNEEEAQVVRDEVRKLENSGNLSLDDAQVVSRDAEGKIHAKGQVDRGVGVGAVAGGAIGLLLFGLLFPIGGLVIGALAGAGIGKLAGLGVDKKFIKDVQDALKPGTSALFLVVRHANFAALRATIEPHEGTIYQTTISPEDEETLKRALSDGVGWQPETPPGSESQ